MHIHIHTYTHTHIQTYTHTHTHIPTYTHTYIHTCTHTHIHTYTHTHIHTKVLIPGFAVAGRAALLAGLRLALHCAQLARLAKENTVASGRASVHGRPRY